MITKILTVSSIKKLIGEIFFNKQDKITTLSSDSGVSALFYSIAKLFQKATADIALVETQRLPQFASGTQLDEAAILYGTPSRLPSSGSSTWVELRAEPGTTYVAVTNRFKGADGIVFELAEDFTVGDLGYGYVNVRSVEIGVKTNVKSNTLIYCLPEPIGHKTVVNKNAATGGRDEENDVSFRKRIQSHNNKISKGTISALTENARSFNSDILKIINYGIDLDGELKLCVVLQNGQELSQSELDELLDNMEPYFSLTDINKFGDSNGVKFVNPVWFEVNGTIGVDFRVQLFDNFDIATVRNDMLVAINDYLNFNTWDYTKKIEWDSIFELIKNVDGVRYVPDKQFNPNKDESVPYNTLPRLKKFIMRDLNGDIILESDTLVPIYYNAD